VLILKEFAVWGDDAVPVEPGGAPVWLEWVDSFDLAQGKRAEELGQQPGRVGLREWEEILRSADSSGAPKVRSAQGDRRGRRVKRRFVGRGRRLEMVRKKRRKQIPRYARNDNSRGVRRV
jgi:hypothetical protein